MVFRTVLKGLVGYPHTYTIDPVFTVHQIRKFVFSRSVGREGDVVIVQTREKRILLL